MRFWDTSALVLLLIDEAATEQLSAIGKDGAEVAVWWGTVVECTSAMERRVRGQRITFEAHDRGLKVLDQMTRRWHVVSPDVAVLRSAVRAARLHGLTAGDALQLAAALAWAMLDPAGLEFVVMDRELRAAAQREGFTVLPE